MEKVTVNIYGNTDTTGTDNTGNAIRADFDTTSGSGTSSQTVNVTADQGGSTPNPVSGTNKTPNAQDATSTDGQGTDNTKDATLAASGNVTVSSNNSASSTQVDANNTSSQATGKEVTVNTGSATTSQIVDVDVNRHKADTFKQAFDTQPDGTTVTDEEKVQKFKDAAGTTSGSGFANVAKELGTNGTQRVTNTNAASNPADFQRAADNETVGQPKGFKQLAEAVASAPGLSPGPVKDAIEKFGKTGDPNTAAAKFKAAADIFGGTSTGQIAKLFDDFRKDLKSNTKWRELLDMKKLKALKDKAGGFLVAVIGFKSAAETFVEKSRAFKNECTDAKLLERFKEVAGQLHNTFIGTGSTELSESTTLKDLKDKAGPASQPNSFAKYAQDFKNAAAAISGSLSNNQEAEAAINQFKTQVATAFETAGNEFYNFADQLQAY